MHREDGPFGINEVTPGNTSILIQHVILAIETCHSSKNAPLQSYEYVDHDFIVDMTHVLFQIFSPNWSHNKEFYLIQKGDSTNASTYTYFCS